MARIHRVLIVLAIISTSCDRSSDRTEAPAISKVPPKNSAQAKPVATDVTNRFRKIDPFSARIHALNLLRVKFAFEKPKPSIDESKAQITITNISEIDVTIHKNFMPWSSWDALELEYNQEDIGFLYTCDLRWVEWQVLKPGESLSGIVNLSDRLLRNPDAQTSKALIRVFVCLYIKDTSQTPPTAGFVRYNVGEYSVAL